MISVNVDITLMARFILQNKVLKFLIVSLFIKFFICTKFILCLIKKIVSVIKTVLQQKCILRVYLAQKTHYGTKLGTKNPLDVGIGIGI